MVYNFIQSSIIILLILEICNPLENKAEHNNNMINKFCIASIKSKLKFEDKQKTDEISHFTCECFLREFNSGSSIRSSRFYCKNKASLKYNL